MRFVYPPTISSGDVLSKVQLDSFRLNDEFFNGVADAWRPIWYGVERGFVGDELSLLIYDGRHLLRSDAKTLCYYIFATGGGGSTVTTRLYYDDSQIANVSSSGSTQVNSGTADLSGKSPGLYRVHAMLERNQAGGGTGGLRSPYSRYTGSRSYTTPPTITDGSVSSASHFTAWRDNDLYFRDMIHPNPAFTGLKGACVGTALNRDLWTGWDRWNPEHNRMYYSVWIENLDSGHYARIYYDYGGGSQVYKTLNQAGWNTGYWDVTGSRTRGSYYKVRVRLYRTDTGYYRDCEVGYLLMAAPSKDADYTVQGQFTAGQYVYGNTGGQSTRLSLLSANDAAIRDRLIWADGSTERQDYAVAEPEFINLGGTDRGSHAFARRFDLLYHRTQGAQIKWAEEAYSLEAFDDDHPYRVANLNSVGIPRGAIYTVEGSQLDFAMEVPT